MIMASAISVTINSSRKKVLYFWARDTAVSKRGSTAPF
jgi:hypothetical protein